MNIKTRQKGFTTPVVLVLLILVLGVAGYLMVSNKKVGQLSPTSQPTQVIPEGVMNSWSDSCNIIDGSNFISTNEYEVGLGSNGPAMGRWRIIFKNGSFQWGHSDVSESGTYKCDNSILEAKLFNRSITAHYDVSRNTLVWDGVEYKKSE